MFLFARRLSMSALFKASITCHPIFHSVFVLIYPLLSSLIQLHTVQYLGKAIFNLFML